MLLSAKISEKSFGSTVLHSDIDFEIQDGEKIGLIGRNGTGKSTLFNILTGADTDFQGEVRIRKGTTVVSSRQEHYGHEDKTVLEYIQGDLPEYKHLVHIIDTYPQTMGSDQAKIQKFSSAVERFEELDYYHIEEEIQQAFEKYQIDPSYMHKTLGTLSGGQQRMVELIKMQRSRGHLILIDEPTNHMDYVAKDTFIQWLKATKEAVLVITHDRDVLDAVDRIIELRDGTSYSFRGNYSSYLRTNKNQVASEVSTYDLLQKQIKNLEQDVVRFKRMKEKARNPGTIRQFKSQEQKARAKLNELRDVEKPSFWIDQDSAAGMKNKAADTYDKYKATNIKVRTRKRAHKGSNRVLVRVNNLCLGYDGTPLFNNVSFAVSAGERVRLHGRNGAGKTTLVQAVMSQAQNAPLGSQCFAGEVEVENELNIGLYEQAMHPKYLMMTLADAIEHIYRDKDQPIDQQKIKQVLSDYLFNPVTDGATRVELLSGGQKARLQLIAMLANDPQILILDEPTNHLDLPSIEELENALMSYHGAIIYVSHDSFFARKLGGETVPVG